MLICILSLSWASAQNVFIANGLYAKGAGDARIFTNYYKSKQEFLGVKTDQYLTLFPSVIYGLSNKINLGLRTKFRQVKVNDQRGSEEPFPILRKSYSRHRLTALEFILRHAISNNLKQFSVQHTIGIPLGLNLAGDRGYIDWNGSSLLSELYYSNSFDKFQIFSSLGIQLENIEKTVFNSKKPSYLVFSLPVTLISGYQFSEKHFLYLLNQTSLRWSFNKYFSNNNLEKNTYSDKFYQLGIGYKYFVTSKLELEPIATLFYDFPNLTQAFTLNFGIRYYY